MSQYEKRDVESLGDDYARHVQAMTAEGLHSKADIAAELAHRDRRIHELEAEVARLGQRVTIRTTVREAFQIADEEGE